MSQSLAPADGRTATFRLSERAGVWQVTREHAFWGDYLSRRAAEAGACQAARSFEAAGGSARVLLLPGETPIPHHPPHKS
jgi:hypothetical protein